MFKMNKPRYFVEIQGNEAFFVCGNGLCKINRGKIKKAPSIKREEF